MGDQFIQIAYIFDKYMRITSQSTDLFPMVHKFRESQFPTLVRIISILDFCDSASVQIPLRHDFTSKKEKGGGFAIYQ